MAVRLLRIAPSLCALLLALCCALPRPCRASPLFELTGDTLSDGGFNARVWGASSASTYFNPALLTRARPGLELGWFVLNDAISITLDARNPAVDVPTSAVNRIGTDLPSVPTAWLDQGCAPSSGQCVQRLAPHPRQRQGSSGGVNTYQSLGFVHHFWPNYLSFGVTAMVPLSAFTKTRAFFADEREQFFSNSLHPEFYSDRLTPISLAFGLGSRPLRWLSLGLSFTLGLNNAAGASTYVGNSAKLSETLQLSTRVDVTLSVSPHGGVVIEPIDKLHIALTVHSPQKMVIDTAFGTYLPNGDLQSAQRPATHAYLPWITGLSLAYDLTPSWALAGTVSFERWSQYLDRQSARPYGAYAFRDTFTESLGLRFHRGAWKTGIDALYRPSPVPRQTGRTNYVDNDRIGTNASVSYDWLLPQWKLTLRFAARAQVHVLPRRHQTKLDPTSPANAGRAQLVVDEWPDGTRDISTGQVIREAAGLQTNNPGWPGFASQGFLLGGGLSVSLLY